ncbi:unnamed protein product [Prunus brigantina]
MHLSVWEFIIKLRSGVTASDNRFLRFGLFPYLTRLKPVIFSQAASSKSTTNPATAESICPSYAGWSFTELAEGLCLKNYEYLGSGEVYDKKHKWTVELPTDSHLLLYLFCDFLEHSKWMLQVVDPDPPLELLRAKIPLSLH